MYCCKGFNWVSLNDDIGASADLSCFTPDAASITSSIKYHAEFTPLFSPERFELPKAFFATAQSVRDALLINWNATYDFCDKMNVKQAYYLSMEFLQVLNKTPCLLNNPLLLHYYLHLQYVAVASMFSFLFF